MFTLSVRLNDKDISGFKALDRRRALGLPDAPTLYSNTKTFITHPVSEAFARTWFGNEFHDSADVKLDWLVAGEVTAQNNSYWVTLAPSITVERAMELYVKARFDALDKE